MKKATIAFPKIAGINIYIHWTFWLIIFYIIYINFRAGLDAMQIGWSVLFVMSLFVCVVLHEYGHALTARRFGIRTKDITLYPIGGVARLEKMPEKPSQELLVALAGPLVNVVIMLLLLPFIMNFELPVGEEDPQQALIIGADSFLPMLGIINIWLALFNLIPAFPMDGGRVLRALLAMKMGRLRATSIAANIGKVLAVGFVIAGFYFNPFLIFIGLFIILGAQAEAQMVKTESFISDLTAADAMMTRFQSLDKNESIGHAVNLLLAGTAKNFLITNGNIPFGTVGRDQIIKGIRDFGDEAPVGNITDDHLVTVNINTPLNEVFSLFQQSATPLILVNNGHQLQGIIDTENIAELIMIRGAREKSGL